MIWTLLVHPALCSVQPWPVLLTPGAGNLAEFLHWTQECVTGPVFQAAARSIGSFQPQKSMELSHVCLIKNSAGKYFI